MRAVRRAALVLSLFAAPLHATGPERDAARTPLVIAVPPARAAHDVHLSYMKMTVDGRTITCRVRVFRDDIQGALRRHLSSPTFQLAATRASDSVFAAYFNTHVAVSSGRRRLSARVLESGLDAAVSDQSMWSYVVELSAPGPVRSLSVRVGLLFDLFEDQRNVVTVVRMPKEERFSLYFVAGDAGEKTVRF